MLLVGGHALRYYNLDPQRKSLDRDFICTIDEYENRVQEVKAAGQLVATYPTGKGHMVIKMTDGNIEEFEIAWAGSDSTSVDILEFNKGLKVATLDTLLMMKLSHRFLRNSPHFYKTMADIKLLRQYVTLDPFMKKLLKKREAETYTYEHPSLKRDKANFFDGDGVEYVYDHDTIHEAIAYNEKPAYEYFKADTAEVFCDKQKFKELPELIKLHSVAEEAGVLAIERSLVPFPGVKTPKEAFEFALMKVCTSIASGWWRRYAWENHDKVLAIYDDTYFDKFNAALERGDIKPFTSSEYKM